MPPAISNAATARRRTWIESRLAAPELGGRGDHQIWLASPSFSPRLCPADLVGKLLLVDNLLDLLLLGADAHVDDPFRTGGPVTGEFFTDRAREVERIVRALTSPASRLLVFGPRRMGKTSCVAMARLGAERKKVRVISADLSTASTPADAANRILEAASRVLWKAAWDNFTRRLARVVPEPAVTLDEVTGMPVFSLRARVRREDPDAQLRAVEGVLDTLDEHARSESLPMAVVLDEFQEIHPWAARTPSGACGA